MARFNKRPQSRQYCLNPAFMQVLITFPNPDWIQRHSEFLGSILFNSGMHINISDYYVCRCNRCCTSAGLSFYWGNVDWVCQW